MVHWVKNQTAATWVTAEMWVQSMAQYSGLKELALPQIQLGFSPLAQELAYATVKKFFLCIILDSSSENYREMKKERK